MLGYLLTSLVPNSKFNFGF